MGKKLELRPGKTRRASVDPKPNVAPSKLATGQQARTQLSDIARVRSPIPGSNGEQAARICRQRVGITRAERADARTPIYGQGRHVTQ